MYFKVGGKPSIALKIHNCKNVITRSVQMILINHHRINMNNVVEYIKL